MFYSSVRQLALKDVRSKTATAVSLLPVVLPCFRTQWHGNTLLLYSLKYPKLQHHSHIFTFVNSECWRLASGHQRPPKAVNMAQSASSSVHGWTFELRRSISERLGICSSRPLRRRWQASKSASQMCSNAGPPQLQREREYNLRPVLLLIYSPAWPFEWRVESICWILCIISSIPKTKASDLYATRSI